MSINAGDLITSGTAVFKVKKMGGSGLIGAIEWYAGSSMPDGYLLCDGSEISRTDYAELFEAIGTVYGEGDGSTTFTLPCLTDGRFIEGSDTAGMKYEAGLPNMQATFGSMTLISEPPEKNLSGETNPFYMVAATCVGMGGGTNHREFVYFDASRANAIYGNSTTVQPTALTLRPLIKYN